MLLALFRTRHTTVCCLKNVKGQKKNVLGQKDFVTREKGVTEEELPAGRKRWTECSEE